MASRYQLEVWQRIQNNTATPEEHAEALAWAEQYCLDAENEVKSSFEEWYETHGDHFLSGIRSGRVEKSTRDYKLGCLVAFKYADAIIQCDGIEGYLCSRNGDAIAEAAYCSRELGVGELAGVFNQMVSILGPSIPQDVDSRSKAFALNRKAFERLEQQYYDARSYFETEDLEELINNHYEELQATR